MTRRRPGPRLLEPSADALPSSTDILVIGAGIIGVAIGARLAAAGAQVCVVDREGPAAGTSSSGEGNILVSDKLPGPELDLALRSISLWQELAEETGPAIELERKGGLIVAAHPDGLESLRSLASAQAESGTRCEMVDPSGLVELEPAIDRALAGGVFYQDDWQVQPMLAVAEMARRLRHDGGRLVGGTEIFGARRRGDRIVAVESNKGSIAIGSFVVNAAGPWGGELAKRLGAQLAVTPRRGHILVTEPAPAIVRHKVYEASYIDTIHEQPEDWIVSAVVESTRAGTILLGSSREFAGFSRRPNEAIIAAIAKRAVALFPDLARIKLMRSYLGFRPATPDQLPFIGPDPGLTGLFHATGHEGAGIGLSLATAELVEAMVLGSAAPVDPTPFDPGRLSSDSIARSGHLKHLA